MFWEDYQYYTEILEENAPKTKGESSDVKIFTLEAYNE